MLFELAGISNVDFRSLSWKLLVIRMDGIGFGWILVGDMCTMCAIYPVKMSSIGDMSRFGGNSKVYKCSLSWNRLITSVMSDGFHSNLVECMGSIFTTYPVKMSSIGGWSRFGGNSKVDKCSLSWNQLITRTDGIGIHSNLDGCIASVCRFSPVNMSLIWGVKKIVIPT